jgi:osmotically-inducible protein OsmY
MGKRLVPAMALSYSPERDYLLLDDTHQEFADEPSYHATPAANGQKEKGKEETATTKPTTIALEQGVSYRDIDRTVLINREIRSARLPARNVEVGTLHGRVTLRGWVPTETVRADIARIAVSASRLELVDNQLVVGPPPPTRSPATARRSGSNNCARGEHPRSPRANSRTSKAKSKRPSARR